MAEPQNQPVDQPAASKPERVPKLLWFLGINLIIGAAIGVAFASVVILLNTGGIKDLIAGSKEPFFAIALLYAMNALTFASLAMGVAVMRLPYDGLVDMREREDPDDPGPLR